MSLAVRWASVGLGLPLAIPRHRPTSVKCSAKWPLCRTGSVLTRKGRCGWPMRPTAGCSAPRPNHPVIGAKNFTEQVVLGELLAQEIESRSDVDVERRFYLAGSYICHQALTAGRIDAYVEYTGTALTAILKQPVERDPQRVLATVRNLYQSKYQITVGPPLGFENTFAMVIRGDDAQRLHLTTLSQADR